MCERIRHMAWVHPTHGWRHTGGARRWKDCVRRGKLLSSGCPHAPGAFELVAVVLRANQNGIRVFRWQRLAQAVGTKLARRVE